MALKEGTANAAISEVFVVVPAEDDAARVKYERYQRLMSAMEDLYIGMVQVVHSDTVVVEGKNARINVLSRGTYNTGKHVS